MPILTGGGQNYWSFIHPEDVAAAIVRILEVQPPGEVYNIADDEPARMADALKWLAEHLHAHPPKSIAPLIAKMALGGDAVDLLTSSRRISSRTSPPTTSTRWVPIGSPAGPDDARGDRGETQVGTS